MYVKNMLGLKEAEVAMRAVLAQAAREPDRPVAVAVVDDDGKLVAYSRMDGCRPLPQQLAIRKAYTSAIMRSDTLAFAERIAQMGRSIAEFGDPGLTTVQGGVVVQGPGGGFLGGIGVSGLRAEEDEALARAGLAAMAL